MGTLPVFQNMFRSQPFQLVLTVRDVLRKERELLSQAVSVTEPLAQRANTVLWHIGGPQKPQKFTSNTKYVLDC